jgi:HEAT repeat protein
LVHCDATGFDEATIEAWDKFRESYRREDAARVCSHLRPLLAAAQPETRVAAAALLLTFDSEDRAATEIVVRDLGRAGSRGLSKSEDVLMSVGSAAVSAFLGLLREKNEDLRLSGVENLGLLGPRAREALPALVDRLADNSRAVRISAAEALLRIEPGQAEARQLLAREFPRPDPNGSHPAADSLMRLGPRAEFAIPTLTASLRDKALRVRVCACELLGNLGPLARSATPALVVSLRDEEWPAVAGAAKALGKIGSGGPEVEKALQAVRRHPEWVVRRETYEALGKLGPTTEDSFRAVLDGLKDPEWSVRSATRRQLTRSLWMLKAGARPLRAAMRDPDPEVSIPAAVALGKAEPGNVEAISLLRSKRPELTTWLGDRGFVERMRLAADGWGLLGQEAGPAVPILFSRADWYDINSREMPVRDVLVQLGPVTVPHLRTLLRDRSPGYADAIRLLSLLGPEGQAAVPELLPLLTDRSDGARMGPLLEYHQPCVAVVAAQLLRRHDPASHPVALKALRRILDEEEDLHQKVFALDALGEFEQAARAELPVIRRSLDHAHWRVRLAAAHTVLRIAPADHEARQVILKGLTEVIAACRFQALCDLSQLRLTDSDSLKAVRVLTEDGCPEVREKAMRTLTTLWPRL